MPPKPPPQKSNNPNTRMPPTHRTQQPALEHAGKLFRVRDKNDAAQEQWGRVWAVNLDWQAADKEKQVVCAKGWSRNARLEEMTVQNPGDPQEGNPDGTWTYELYRKLQAVEIAEVEAARAKPLPAPREITSSKPKSARVIPPPPIGVAQAAAASAAKAAQERHDAHKRAELKKAAAELQQRQLAELEAAANALDINPDDATDGLDDVSMDDLARAEAEAADATDSADAS